MEDTVTEFQDIQKDFIDVYSVNNFAVRDIFSFLLFRSTN